MATQSRTGAALVVTGSLLLVFGVLQFFREATPYFVAGISAEQRFAAVIGGGYKPAASRLSKDLIISDCLSVPRSAFARLQPPARQDQFAEECRDIARAAVAEMPTYSAAWLVVAVASAKLDDVAGFRSALVASQQTGADVHWLGEQRVNLAAANIDNLDDAASAAYRRDLRALFDSRGGAEVLARLYLANPAERERITEAGESAPSDMKQFFLNRVRTLSTGGDAR